MTLSIDRDDQLRTSLYDKRDDFNFHITKFPFLCSNIPSSPAFGVFISQLIRYVRACSSYECFMLRIVRFSNKLLGQGYVKERLKSSLRKFYGSCQTIWGPALPNVTRHSEWWSYTVTPSFDQKLHQFLTLYWFGPYYWVWIFFYQIVYGFPGTFATGAVCQQRTLTPPYTWSCLTFGLACVLMSRPISPELVLFPDLWVSNIPRYFSFALNKEIVIVI